MAKKQKTNAENAKASQAILGEERGATGTQIASGYITEEYNPNLSFPQSFRVYDEMRKSDATVAAILKVIKLPLQRADYYFSPASDSDQDKAIAKHLEYEFFDRLNFYSNVLPQILIYLDFGFMCFEKVYQIEKTGEYKGKLGIKKLAPRLPKSLDQWIETDYSEPSMRQSGYKKDAYQTVTIDGAKLVRFTNDQEGNNYEGVSILRPAYKHWFFKYLLEKTGAIGADRTANGVPVLEYTADVATTPEEKEKNAEVLRNISANEAAYIDLGFGKKFRFETTQAGYDIMPLLQHHDRQITKAVLAQFLETGAAGTSGGYAQTKSDQEFFYNSIESFGIYICDRLNDLLIKEFVFYNYGDVTPPKLSIKNIKPQGSKELSSLVSESVKSGVLTADVDVENLLREFLGLPLLDEKILFEPAKQLSDCGCGDHKKKINLSDKRELTLAEKKIDIAGQTKKLDDSESKIEEIALAYSELVLSDTITSAEQFYRDSKFAGLSDKTKEARLKSKAELIAEQTDLYEFFKAETVKEVEETQRPATPKDTKQLIKDSAELYLESIENDMAKEAKSTIISAKNKGFDLGDAIAALAASLLILQKKQVNAFVGILGGGLMNRAISEVHEFYVDKVVLEQFSAVLDNQTSPMCLSLDGRVDVLGKLPKPPIHGECRSRLVAILADQTPLPAINPAPKSIVEKISPNPFKTVQPETPSNKKNSPAQKQIDKNKGE